MKLKGKQLRTVQGKLEAAKQSIDAAREDSFIKEACYQLLEQARQRIEEIQHIVGVT